MVKVVATLIPCYGVIGNAVPASDPAIHVGPPAIHPAITARGTRVLASHADGRNSDPRWHVD